MGFDEYRSAFFFKFFCGWRTNHTNRDRFDRERALMCMKRRKKKRTKVKRIERHDTRNKASGCSRFGSNFRHYATKRARHGKGSLPPRHGIGGPVRACVRACVHMHMRACVSTRYSQLARSWRKRVTKAELERQTPHLNSLYDGGLRELERSRACMVRVRAPLRAICASLFAMNTYASARVEKHTHELCGCVWQTA